MLQTLLAGIAGVLIVLVSDVAKHITHFDLKKWFYENYERVLLTIILVVVLELIVFLVPESIAVMGSTFGIVIDPTHPAAHTLLGAAITSYTLISAKKNKVDDSEDLD